MRPSVARRRSRPGSAQEADGIQHVVFKVGGDEYALPLLDLQEIARAAALARVRAAPPALRGILALRGEPVAVGDLAVVFGGRAVPDTPESCVLIATGSIGGQRTLVGLAVDAVSRVIGLAPADIAPAPRLGGLIDVELVPTMARVRQELVPILALERLLASEELRDAVIAARAATE